MSFIVRNGQVMIHYNGKKFTEDTFKLFYPDQYASLGR